MKNKLILINIILIFIFTTLISTEAIAPTPKIELEDYQLTILSPNDVYISGNVNMAKGQYIGIYDSTGYYLYAFTSVKNTGKSESFKIKIPSGYIKLGDNTYKVKSLPIREIINGSNPKTVTIKYNKKKEDQIITVSNLSLNVGETKNLNAKINSNLSLTYKSENPSIATVDPKGNVVGRSVGSTNVVISQVGNDKYNAAKKTIKITVNKQPVNKKNQTITCNPLTLKKGEKKNLNARVSSNLPLTYKSKNSLIATVDSKGNVTGKKTGTTSIIIKQAGNDKYNSVSKTVSVTVKENTNTYTVVFNPNGGKGSTYSQKIEVGKSAYLKDNKFKRNGYEFVGWATKSNKQKISGTDVTKFKNVNMKHFQLGKVSYKNKAKVKNLASKNKKIVLYAVWKGNGPQAALDWGKLIADDNHFIYNTKKSSNNTYGCWFCGDNKKKGKKVFNGGKHYVCMTFVDACYAHGANCKSFWSKDGTCYTTYIDGNSKISKIKKKARLKTLWYNYKGNKYGKKPSLNSLKPGDILVTQTKAKGGHVVMYWGKNSKGKHLMLECTKSSRAKGKSGQIALHNVSDWYNKKCEAVFRFKG